VVGAVHPSSRQDEWMNTYQWRLSFSRAEVTLLNSWTPIQQIVYHMLRFVLKREVLSEIKGNDPGLPKLSNYNIKTLMLWECEQKPQSWWSTESSLVTLCSLLLYKLSDWVADKQCQHYFISNCNLLDDFSDESSQTFSNKVRSLGNVAFLLLWFFENYICKCAQCCPENVSKLFEEFCRSSKLHKATRVVIDWKLCMQSRERFSDNCKSEKMMLSFQLLCRPDTLASPMLRRKLENLDSRLQDYFIAVTSLWVAYTLSIHSLTKDILEVLWILFTPCRPTTAVVSDTDTNGLDCEKLLSIRKATYLATLSIVRSNALEMLHIEMSKAYLYQTLGSQNGRESESTGYVVHILLATLHYKSGQYPAAIDHCKQVLNQHDSEGCRLCDIAVECLLLPDPGVDSVFGLIQLYQYVKPKTLLENLEYQQDSKPAVTAQLFAHYLHLKCSSAADAKVHQSKYRYHLSMSIKPLLSDVLLFKALEMQLGDCIEIPVESLGNNGLGNDSCCMDTNLLVILAELVSLEKLIKFRQKIIHEVHSEQFPVLNEFELLHAYGCGLFEECLEMCQNHINLLLRASCLRNQLFIIGLPVFVSLLDGELLSLFGVIRLLHPIVCLHLLQFPDAESISLLTLLLYLVFQCQKKLHSGLLRDTLHLIRYVHDIVYPADDKAYFVDRLILKLTYRSLKLFIDDFACAV